jgi:hypothetical protein
MKVFELFRDPAKHCTGSYALTEHGSSCHPSSPAARQWCLHGAIAYCYGGYSKRVEIEEKVWQALKKLGWEQTVTHFNDSNKPETVQQFAERLGI